MAPTVPENLCVCVECIQLCSWTKIRFLAHAWVHVMLVLFVENLLVGVQGHSGRWSVLQVYKKKIIRSHHDESAVMNWTWGVICFSDVASTSLKSSTNYNYLPVDWRGQIAAHTPCLKAIAVDIKRQISAQSLNFSPCVPVRRGETHSLHITSALCRTASNSHMTRGNLCPRRRRRFPGSWQHQQTHKCTVAAEPCRESICHQLTMSCSFESFSDAAVPKRVRRAKLSGSTGFYFPQSSQDAACRRFLLCDSHFSAWKTDV